MGMIGWLWIAIGGSHVSDRLAPLSSSENRRDVSARGRGSYFDLKITKHMDK